MALRRFPCFSMKIILKAEYRLAFCDDLTVSCLGTDGGARVLSKMAEVVRSLVFEYEGYSFWRDGGGIYELLK